VGSCSTLRASSKNSRSPLRPEPLGLTSDLAVERPFGDFSHRLEVSCDRLLVSGEERELASEIRDMVVDRGALAPVVSEGMEVVSR
jgi:hypothetical protein